MANKWAQKVDIKEGALKAIGGLDADKIWASIKAGKVDYATAIRRVLYLANLGNIKAKRVLAELQRRRKKEQGVEK